MMRHGRGPWMLDGGRGAGGVGPRVLGGGEVGAARRIQMVRDGRVPGMLDGGRWTVDVRPRMLAGAAAPTLLDIPRSPRGPGLQGTRQNGPQSPVGHCGTSLTCAQAPDEA